MLLFKYLSPEAAEKVLQDSKHITIRFSLPKAYNDPYELFLQTDALLDSEELRAFYEYLVGDIPQLPVTCFSRVPDCVPMWAHYAREHSGVCLGFDEDELTDRFPVAYISDVVYSEKPAQISASSINFAYTTAKRRHALGVLAIANRAAYFIKRTHWQYENERRLVVAAGDVQERGSLLLADIGSKALKFIIVGPKANPTLRTLCESASQDLGIPLYEIRNGKRAYAPYFVDLNKTDVFQWQEGEFQVIAEVCSECNEPGVIGPDGECIWCSIDPHTKRDASNRSLLSISLQLGLETLSVSFADLEPKGWKVKNSTPTLPPDPLSQ